MRKRTTRAKAKPGQSTTAKPAAIGAISDQLCDIENLAQGGIDACFGVEHVTHAGCEGPRAIFEAVVRRVGEIKQYATDLAAGKAVQA